MFVIEYGKYNCEEFSGGCDKSQSKCSEILNCHKNKNLSNSS